MKKILLMHGPNINLVGEREPGIYGSESFDSINQETVAYANRLGMECDVFQSNSEGALIDRLHDPQCRRLYPLQHRDPRRNRGHPYSGDRSPPVKRSCAGGIPACFGDRAGLQGRYLWVWKGKLSAGSRCTVADRMRREYPNGRQATEACAAAAG